MGRPEVRVDPILIPPLLVAGARTQRERITKQDIDKFGATVRGVQVVTRSHSDRCRVRIEECLQGHSARSTKIGDQ